ncbi:MAG: hypothetical protein HY824_17520 [Acidobacteria bacterium]|nr:hypothetical protein [Acidobacteriota bacterium]
MPLVLALMTMTLLTALGGALVVGTITETAVAANYRAGTAAFYAADAAAEFAIHELAAAPDWEAVLSGDAASSFADGPPAGVRSAGGVQVDLAEETADVESVAGVDSGDAAIYAYGRLADLAGASAVSSPEYVAVWVTGAPAGEADEPRTITMVARAYGSNGSRRSVAVSMERAPAGEPGAPSRVVAWYELR